MDRCHRELQLLRFLKVQMWFRAMVLSREEGSPPLDVKVPESSLVKVPERSLEPQPFGVKDPEPTPEPQREMFIANEIGSFPNAELDDRVLFLER
ncbi:hypothetical protein ACH5RR_019697 [Cinchona calisaya]|uniref:Uncharacterized protein n=1 Tax=Cinchona calisaya TaxID=153742 RepID=A0ABD2ZQK8_9GENT